MEGERKEEFRKDSEPQIRYKYKIAMINTTFDQFPFINRMKIIMNDNLMLIIIQSIKIIINLNLIIEFILKSDPRSDYLMKKAVIALIDAIIEDFE